MCYKENTLDTLKKILQNQIHQENFFLKVSFKN